MAVNSPLVSVILPVYNQQGTVARAIDSALCQHTDFPYEVIIGDDASADDTLGICREYERRHDNVRVVTNAVNLGLPANYYNLARLARGRYIADLAGDDQWCHPGKLQMQASVMESNPQITLCHTNWVKAHAGTGRIEPSNADSSLDAFRRPLVDGSELFLSMLRHHQGPIVHSCTMMYSRDALVRAMQSWPGIFCSPDLVCEDFQLITSLAAMGQVAFLPEVTLRYTVSRQSITGTRDYARLCRFYTGSLRLTRAIQRIHNVSDIDMAPCYASMVPYIIDLAFRARDHRLMLDALQAASNLPLPLASRIKFLLSALLNS